MLSELMQKKLKRDFAFRDLDADGYVQQADWEQCAHHLAILHGWQIGSAEYEHIVAQHVAMWTNFWQPADSDGDGKVTFTEYVQLTDARRKAGFKLEMEQIQNWLTAVFDAVDGDGDGVISLAEYRLFFQAWGLAADEADVAYAAMDFNADERLSRRAFLQFGVNFYLSDDPAMAGNWMFGRLD